MTKYEELKKIICEALPRLMAHEKDQQYRIDDCSHQSVRKVLGNSLLLPLNGKYLYEFSFEELDEFEVLGIDPTLSDVLCYINAIKTQIEIEDGIFCDYPKDLIHQEIILLWNLSQPLLKDQSEELIDYLLTIKK